MLDCDAALCRQFEGSSSSSSGAFKLLGTGALLVAVSGVLCGGVLMSQDEDVTLCMWMIH
jgi:hypothetical protein